MKQKVLERGTDLLILFMNHCIVSAIAIIVLGVSKFETPYIYVWFGLWSVPLYLYMIRSYVHKIVPFFVLQIFPLLVICSLPTRLGLKLAMIVVTIFYTLTSIKQKLTENGEEAAFVPVFSVAVLGGAYIIDDVMSFRGWHSWYLLYFYLYIICYIGYYFLNQYAYFINVNKNSAGNIPEKQIFHSGIKQIGVYIFGGVSVLLLTGNIEWLKYILNILKNILGIIIRFLTSFSTPSESKTPPMEDAVGNGGGDMGFLEPGEAHIFWIILEKIATIAFFAGLVYVTVIAVIKGYQYLHKNFQRGKKKKEEAVIDGQDVREKCDIEVRARKEIKLFAFLDNKEKIRKNYRKYMIKRKTSIVGDSDVQLLEYHTAKECCDRFSAGNLQKAYEKARYSNETISAEDVRRSKLDG